MLISVFNDCAVYCTAILCVLVRANIYHLLGLFGELYPEHVTKYSNRLFDIYVGALKTEVFLADF